jgi:hypothetical protein
VLSDLQNILVIILILVIAVFDLKTSTKEEEIYRLMKQAMGGRHSHPETRSLARFCGWLCGFNAKGPSASAAPFTQNLPRGMTIGEATPEQLAEALKSAIITSNQQTDAMVKFVFSQLGTSEAAKAEVVIRAVIPLIPVEAVSGFVRTAGRARPSLALTVARTAAGMVPEQSERIANALESVVAGASMNSLLEAKDPVP